MGKAITIIAADGWFDCPACAAAGHRKHVRRIRANSIGVRLPERCPRCKTEYLLRILPPELKGALKNRMDESEKEWFLLENVEFPVEQNPELNEPKNIDF